MSSHATGFKDSGGQEIHDGDRIEYGKAFIFGTKEGIRRAAFVKFSERQQAYTVDGHLLSDIVNRQMLELGAGSTGCKIIESEPV
jgi:hypothetical protein